MNYLSEDIYKIVTANIPIVCVDIIPVKKTSNNWQIGIITRATGPEAGKPALIGGRIYHQEQIHDAITRHLKADCQINKYHLFPHNDVPKPFYVQQYLHQAQADPPLGYDPTKHSIGLTYLVEFLEKPRPQNEARDFRWVGLGEIPKQAAYNHQLLMNEAFQFLLGLKA